MPDITYTLHTKYDGDNKQTHYAKVYSDGEHVENTQEVDSQLAAKICGKLAIERLNRN